MKRTYLIMYEPIYASDPGVFRLVDAEPAIGIPDRVANATFNGYPRERSNGNARIFVEIGTYDHETYDFTELKD